MASRCMKRCSASLTIKEVQIKTTVRYPFISVRMSTVKKRSADKDVGKREHLSTIGGNVNGLRHYRNSMRFPQKSWKQNYYVIQQFHFWVYVQMNWNSKAIFKIHKCVSVDEWVRKMWHVYNGTLFHKKEETLPFATTWMNLEGIMLRGIRQTEKDKYCAV